MYYTARIDNWYPDETPQRVLMDQRFIVARDEDECGIIIRLRNGTNYVMTDQDD